MRYEIDPAKLALQRQAVRQAGRIATWQFAPLGITRGRIQSWTASGFLIPLMPRVYAVGTVIDSAVARLWETILYAGPGAMLSHATAGHWCGLLRYPARDGLIHVSTPRRIGSTRGFEVHGRRKFERCFHQGLPVSGWTQMLLDIAATESFRATRRALSVLGFRQQLNIPGLLNEIDSRTGIVAGRDELRAAINQHRADYWRLNEGLETDMYELLESVNFEPMPEVNVELGPKLIVDFYFREHGVVVEGDGRAGHDAPEQQLEDARRDLRLRGMGLIVIRYRHAQINGEPELVLLDLRSQLAAREWRPAQS
jgi:very-short-patch-repair endonuclease